MAVRKDSLWLGHSSKAASEGIVSRHNTITHALKVLIHYLGTVLSTYIPADGNESRNVMCQQLPAAENISFHLIFCSTWRAGGGRHSPAEEDSIFWGQSIENCTNLALLSRDFACCFLHTQEPCHQESLQVASLAVTHIFSCKASKCITLSIKLDHKSMLPCANTMSCGSKSISSTSRWEFCSKITSCQQEEAQ